MTEADIIAKTEAYVRKTLDGDGSGHDWWHIDNVRNNALHIGREEGADLFVVELGALLHDIADFKFHDGDATVGPRVAREWLESINAPTETTDRVVEIVEKISFKGAGVADTLKSIEGKCVQDADRLEAIGAIGIARCFAYGGSKNRTIYDPNMPPVTHASFDAYKNHVGTTINHFYEKLLLVKDRMNTNTGKRLAEGRHKVMEDFLKEFYAEWIGEK